MRWPGMTFGDPDITWQSVRLVLPVSVAYDILLCPFVLYAVVRFGGYGGWAMAGRRELESLAGREPAGAGLLGGVAAAGLAAGGAAVRDTRSGREPRLRPAAGRQADGWIGGHLTGPGQQAGPWVSRRRPLHLRARGGVAGSAAAAQAGLAARPGPGARPGPCTCGSAPRGAATGCWAARCAPCSAWAWPARPAPALAPAVGPRVPRLGRPGQDGRRRGVTRPAGFRQPVRPAPAAVTRLPRRALGPDRGGPRDAGPDRLAAAARPARGRGARWRRARQPVSREQGAWAVGAGCRVPPSRARRSPGAPGPLRHGRGPGAVPRFRSSGRGLRRWGDRLLPGRRGSRPGGAFAGGASRRPGRAGAASAGGAASARAGAADSGGGRRGVRERSGQEDCHDPRGAPAPDGPVRGGGRAADLARRPALVPAGHDRGFLRQRGGAGPDQDGDRAVGPGRDTRRRRPATDQQQDRAGGIGEPGAGRAAARRGHWRNCTGWRSCCTWTTGCSSSGSGCARAGVSQPCWPGSPYQPIPVDQQASDAVALQIMESQRRVPRGDRAGPAGDPLPAAVRHGRRPDPRVPAAHHPAGGRAASSAGDRLLGRGPGGAGRAGGAVRPAAARDARASRCCGSTPPER